MKTLLSAVVAATLALAAVEAGADGTPGERQVSLVIESKTLADALDEWAKQSGFQIFVKNWSLARKLSAPKLKGNFSAEAALEQLLRGSPLTYNWLNDKAVSITEKPPSWQAIDGSAQRPPMPVSKFIGDSLSGPKLAASDERAGMASRGGAMLTEFDVDPVEEIFVTGTHIRGEAPIGSALVVVGREEIRASGHGRVQDFLEHLPQNFSGSASEDWNVDLGSSNLTRGQAIDLRGLGAGSTLVLIDGRRQPTGGLQGAFVDISSIPAAAIDRIEILSDGASALYGSDAIGGVVNFVLRKDYEGIEASGRYATTDGSSDETQASMVGGWTGSSANLLLGYQYSHRDFVWAKDAAYSSTNRDFSVLGGSDFSRTGGDPGTILDPFTFLPAFAIPAGQNGSALTESDLVSGRNREDHVTGIAVLPEQKQHSAFVSFSDQINDNLSFFAEGRYSRREMDLPFSNPGDFFFVPDTNAFYVDPFDAGFAVVVRSLGNELGGVTRQTSQTDTYSSSLGATVALGPQWQVNVVASYAREKNEWEWTNRINPFSPEVATALADSDPATALNVFGHGAVTNPATINALRSTAIGRGDSEMTSGAVIANGPVGAWRAGEIKIAIGADYRHERLVSDEGSFAPATGLFTASQIVVGRLERDVVATFGEVLLPLIGADNSDAADGVLAASLAVRYEDYSDFGSSLNPKVGLNFRPARGVLLRASWGTSFRAPRFNEISDTVNPPQSAALEGVPDPRSPTGTSNILVIGGVDPNLKEETADVWSAGLDWTSTAIDGLSMGMTYFDIDYKDRIQIGGDFDNTLVFEERWASLIQRDPTQEQIDAICSKPDFFTPCPAAVAAIVDVRLRNLGGLRVRGVDFHVGYRATTAIGNLSAGINGVYTTDYEIAASATDRFVDVTNTVNNPISLRLRGTLGWELGSWHANLISNYTDNYRDEANDRPVGSWTTLDVSWGYRFGNGWMRGTDVLLSAVNVFDEEPPFVNRFTGFDNANANEVGRSIGVSVVKNW
jgi:iron complex outermembrane recepter protein